jgi:hypothetical protein
LTILNYSSRLLPFMWREGDAKAAKARFFRDTSPRDYKGH